MQLQLRHHPIARETSASLILLLLWVRQSTARLKAKIEFVLFQQQLGSAAVNNESSINHCVSALTGRWIECNGVTCRVNNTDYVGCLPNQGRLQPRSGCNTTDGLHRTACIHLWCFDPLYYPPFMCVNENQNSCKDPQGHWIYCDELHCHQSLNNCTSSVPCEKYQGRIEESKCDIAGPHRGVELCNGGLVCEQLTPWKYATSTMCF